MTPEDTHLELETAARAIYRRRPDADVQVNAAELVELFDRLRGMELDQLPPFSRVRDIDGSVWVKTFRETWERERSRTSASFSAARTDLNPADLLRAFGPVVVVLP